MTTPQISHVIDTAHYEAVHLTSPEVVAQTASWLRDSGVDQYATVQGSMLYSSAGEHGDIDAMIGEWVLVGQRGLRVLSQERYDAITHTVTDGYAG